MRFAIVAVDLARNTVEVAIIDHREAQPQFKRFSRRQLKHFIANQTASRFVIEACSTSHFWSRELASLGHEPRMLPARYVAWHRCPPSADEAELIR